MADQLALPLDTDEVPSISIDDVATCLNASTASVRNWIKTGYLVSVQRNRVTLASYDYFVKNIAGSEKLTKRANKQLVDFHDHEKLRASVLERLQIAESAMDIDRIAHEYHESLSVSYKNKEGVYYTPSDIVSCFFDAIPVKFSNLTFFDPCCGTGNFLLGAINAGVLPENIYGFDIDEIALDIAQERIYKITGHRSSNLRVCDFLDFASFEDNSFAKYDIVFTNPPWGKKFIPERKTRYINRFSQGHSIDSSALFLLAGMRFVKLHGFLGFLLPDAFFNIAAYASVRENLLSHRLCSFADFGKPFRSLLTGAKSVIIQINGHARLDETPVNCTTKCNSHIRSQSSFHSNPNYIFNFSSTDETNTVLKQMLSRPHVTLKKHAKWGLGIVTGNNSRFIVDKPSDGYIPVYKGAQVFKDKLEPPTCFIPDDLSQYQQVAPRSLYEAREKIIYRFISSSLVFYYDEGQSYVLNSANMIVLDKEAPVSAKLLVRLWNTEIINFFFQSMFGTHKVLRSDLEMLPIYVDFLQERPDFTDDDLLEYLKIERITHGAFRVKK